MLSWRSMTWLWEKLLCKNQKAMYECVNSDLIKPLFSSLPLFRVGAESWLQHRCQSCQIHGGVQLLATIKRHNQNALGSPASHNEALFCKNKRGPRLSADISQCNVGREPPTRMTKLGECEKVGQGLGNARTQVTSSHYTTRSIGHWGRRQELNKSVKPYTRKTKYSHWIPTILPNRHQEKPPYLWH